MITWDYIAGLFDGDGCFSIGKTPQNTLVLSAIITAKRTDFLETICKWLETEDVYAKINKKGTINNLIIRSGESLFVFLDCIKDCVILKKEHVEIMMRATKLRRNLREGENTTIKANLKRFDVFRHELHALSVKGPKKLKVWITP